MSLTSHIIDHAKIDVQSVVATLKRKKAAVPLEVINFSASGTSDDATTQITATAQVDTPTGSSTVLGVVVNSTQAYQVRLRNTTTKNPIDDGAGNEVYGRLTWAASVYTLTYYSAPGGVEASYSFLVATGIDFIFWETVDLYTMDWLALVRARPWTDIAVTGNFILGEDHTAQVTGSATIFTCTNAFLTNSLKGYKNGISLTRGDDYTETTSTTYTMAIAPVAGDKLTVDYIRT